MISESHILKCLFTDKHHRPLFLSYICTQELYVSKREKIDKTLKFILAHLSKM